ncbi:hypothetical protein HUU62_07085 [Rhodoferax sp. 4810]|nr:hypothetical protein [Rhodoferax jenense]
MISQLLGLLQVIYAANELAFNYRRRAAPNPAKPLAVNAIKAVASFVFMFAKRQ